MSVLRSVTDSVIRPRWVLKYFSTSGSTPARSRIAPLRSARFAASTDPWIVAVRMVSEGVDIPRLRVGVFATNTTTELFFRQAVGRLVRWTRGVRSQRAFLFIPDDPRLRRWATGIAEQRRHSVAKRNGGSDDPLEDATFDDRDQAAAAAGADDGEQMSLFAVISAVASRIITSSSTIATATSVTAPIVCEIAA